jgi:hypothetical protein
MSEIAETYLSLLSQLSTLSNLCSNTFNCVYATHDNGAYMPTGGVLIQSLKQTLTSSTHNPICIIIDARMSVLTLLGSTPQGFVP